MIYIYMYIFIFCHVFVDENNKKLLSLPDQAMAAALFESVETDVSWAYSFQ